MTSIYFQSQQEGPCCRGPCFAYFKRSILPAQEPLQWEPLWYVTIQIFHQTADMDFSLKLFGSASPSFWIQLRYQASIDWVCFVMCTDHTAYWYCITYMIRLSSAASTSQPLKPHQGPSSPVLLHSALILRLPMALPELDSLSDGSQRPRERSASSVCRLCSLPEWKPHPPVQNQTVKPSFLLRAAPSRGGVLGPASPVGVAMFP